jgi:hypothetical protein
MQMELAPFEKAVLDEIGRDLRAHGWATHVTVERLLRDWKELSESVDRCEMTVDDYTNDLTARDGLELVLAKCQEPLRGKVRVLVEAADDDFRRRTVEDEAGAVPRYFRVTTTSGWWWKRKPAGGALAEYFADHS